MNLFVTGATDVLGKAVLRQLVSKGHNIKALSRSDGNRASLIEWDAAPVEADVFDPASLASAFEGCEAVLHLATKIPAIADMKKPGIWTENDRLRRDGMRAIVTAARETAGLHTIIYPSVSFFYADSGDRWIDAESADVHVIPPLNSTLDAEADVSAFAKSSPDRRGIILRFASFYGPDSADSRKTLEMAQKGFAIRLAPQNAYRSMIWIHDAASAVVEALESAPSGVFDAVESEPYTQMQSVHALANATGRKSLLVLPRWLLRIFLPAEMRGLVARSQRISNKRFCNLTGWRPSVPDQQKGWALMGSDYNM